MGSIPNQQAVAIINEEDEEETGVHAMAMIYFDVLHKVLRAANSIGLFDILAVHSKTCGISSSDIAQHLEAKNPNASSMIDRILYLLASHSLLVCSLTTLEVGGKAQRLYRLAPAATFFVNNEDGCSLAAFLQQENSKDPWGHLKDSIIEGGIPFVRATNMSLYEHAGAHGWAIYFNKSMNDHSNIVMRRILQKYKGFEDCGDSLVDVGGGTGSSLRMIITKYPSIKGINFDLPAVIKQATPYQGIEHVEGDMFVSIPKGDTILLKWISHNWSDEQFLTILEKCYEALPLKGKVVMIESILPMEPDPSWSTKYVAQLDIVMLLNLGGRERTSIEFETLSKAAGFSHIRFILSGYANWVIELYK